MLLKVRVYTPALTEPEEIKRIILPPQRFIGASLGARRLEPLPSSVDIFVQLSSIVLVAYTENVVGSDTPLLLSKRTEPGSIVVLPRNRYQVLP